MPAYVRCGQESAVQCSGGQIQGKTERPNLDISFNRDSEGSQFKLNFIQEEKKRKELKRGI
jgi:hypothetical protein